MMLDHFVLWLIFPFCFILFRYDGCSSLSASTFLCPAGLRLYVSERDSSFISTKIPETSFVFTYCTYRISVELNHLQRSHFNCSLPWKYFLHIHCIVFTFKWLYKNVPVYSTKLGIVSTSHQRTRQSHHTLKMLASYPVSHPYENTLWEILYYPVATYYSTHTQAPQTHSDHSGERK